MPSTPSVSVVIPVRNRPAPLAAALASLAAQTHADWEAVVVDDGSTDATAAVVADLARSDSRMRLERLRDGRGAQAARNRGIGAARGEWIAFLDSDDAYFPDSLARRLAEAQSRGVAVVHSECEVIDASGRRRFGVPPMSGRVYRALLERPGPMYQGLLARRTALERIGPLDEALVAYQEWDTAIRLAEHYAFGFVAEPTFLYDCRQMDTISSDAARAARGYGQVLRKHWRAILFRAGPRALVRHHAGLRALRRAAASGQP